MANIAIFRINYKSDFILTLNSDAGWATPFCVKFWTGAPSQAYFVGYDGTTYTHCAPVAGDPTKLEVQFDDHHLPIGDLKFQIGYHFTVADFPTSVEDEVINQAAVIIDQDGTPMQVMLDLNGETAPEIEFSLPAYANEAQRIANEQQRIAAETQRIANEETRIQHEESRIAAEQTRQQNEQQRINQEQARVNEYARLKADAVAATGAANDAAALANQKAQLAADKAALAQAASYLANAKAQLAADKAALADAAATLANQKAALAQQKAEYAQEQGTYSKNQGDYAKEQGDYSKAQGDYAKDQGNYSKSKGDYAKDQGDYSKQQGDYAKEQGEICAADHLVAVEDHQTAAADHQTATTDHSTALSDHTQAGNDHTRAESDHDAVELYVDSLGVFDLSKHNAVGGVLATYADLDAALTALNALESKYKYGGMSFKFVQSFDNNYVQYNYVQYRYMGTDTTANAFTNTANWQGVDDKPEVESQNLVTSGGVIEVMRQIDKVNVTAAGEGVTPFVFKAGTTYHIRNNSVYVTISHRNTPNGTSEDVASVPAYGEIDYTPTTDGLYLRYGSVCNIDIYVKGSLYDEMKEGDASLSEDINDVDEKQKLHSSIARYAIQAEGFEDGRYWYYDNGKVSVLTNSTSIAGVIEKIPVSAGDDICFNVFGNSGSVLLAVTDSENNVLAFFNGSTINSLSGRYVIPANGAYLYVNTLKTEKDKSYCIVNAAFIPKIENRFDIDEECLNLSYSPTVQDEKYYDASGTLQSRSGLKAFEISDLTGIIKIRCKVGVSSYAYYGFVVNSTFVAKRWVANEHDGENSGTVILDVPDGATKFLCSWATSIVTEQEVTLLKVGYIDEKIGAIKEDTDKVSKIVDAADVLYNLKKDWVVGRLSMATGEIDELDSSRTSFKSVEISLDDFFVKTVTFKKTYVGDSSWACYGFVINNVWVGYQGVYPASVVPFEVTVEVPRGATKFKCCWNSNQATEDELVVKAVGYKFSNEPKPNQPVYQFEPDFVLSRVPQMTCPTESAVNAITLAELYAKYDALVTAYPDYVTKVDCDTEVQTALEITAPSYMEGLPIYMYKFMPSMGTNNSGVSFNTKPKIFITSMHPQERLGVIATYEMMKMVCENWASDVNAEQLRSFVDIYVLPAPWSWNFENKSRANYNGINGNRQFPTKHWAESGQNTTNWSGTAPLSEYEAKVVNYYLLQIKPDACLDVHTSGNDNQGHMGVLLVNENDQPLVNLCGVIARSTSNRAIQDNQNFPSNPNVCIYGVYPENAETLGEFYEYAYEQGCKYSILSEESPFSRWDDGVYGGSEAPIIEQYTDGILREQVQYLFNTILRLTKAACIQYYKE